MKNGLAGRNSTDSRTGVGQTAYKRRLACERLGIDPKDVEPVPFFRYNLRRIARRVNQGRTKDEMIHPFDYLLSSADPEARKVAKAYFSVPESYRRLLPPEAFCHAAGVSPYHVLGIIASVAVEFGARASTVLASTMLPSIVQKVIDKALEKDGTKDRVLFFRLAQYLPARCGW
jgi:hypothetical protein